jgi:hypothetical protein
MGELALGEGEGALEVLGQQRHLVDSCRQALVQRLGGLNTCLVHSLGLQQ